MQVIKIHFWQILINYEYDSYSSSERSDDDDENIDFFRYNTFSN